MIQGRSILETLIVLSMFCLLVLVGGFLYSGSLLPTTGEGESKDVVTWVLWILIIGIPILTFCLIMLALWKRRK